MEENIRDLNNTQFFSDCTYYAVIPFYKGAKLLLLLAFNKNLMKAVLCTISLIKNENKETILKILEFLELKYNFKPNNITLDFRRGPITSFKYKFPNIKIVPCFFHFIQKIILHLSEVKSANNKNNKDALNLLSNIKLICFWLLEYIDPFFEKKNIKKIPKFFSYFERIYWWFFSDRCWNHYNLSVSTNNNDYYFFTNNIWESTNRTLNNWILWLWKNIYSFTNAIINLIDFFDNKKIYEENYISITRTLNY